MSSVDEHSDFWRHYDGESPAAVDETSSFDASPEKLTGEFRYNDHRTIRHKSISNRESVILDFIHVETGQTASMWFNAVLGPYHPGAHGRFRVRPGHKLYGFIIQTIGEPKQWCRAWRHLSRLKKIELIGVAVKKADGWVVKTMEPRRIESARELQSFCTKSAGDETAGGKTAGGNKCDNTLTNIEKTEIPCATIECNKKMQRPYATNACNDNVHEMPPKNHVTQEEDTTLSITTEEEIPVSHEQTADSWSIDI